ncbi:hypothetical protein [Anabaena sp. UHCC 0451]|uniref:hypothetical protein n=1 Tax=Anabaena sp. UHCC 0451 TaxID=2055235 RepID=UPI002B1F34EA|nr:hypothetical protein [Anabaena sp. UHCC 0451]MEA5578502.1 hypothetical protein [Anabaena sp. UHCC 0451]
MSINVGISVASMNIIEKLNEEGFVMIENYVQNTIVKELENQIKNAFTSEQVIYVNNDGIVISTINGNELLSRSPLTCELYKSTLNFLKSCFSEIVEIDDTTIGISANKLNSKNDRFRLHFDRNQLTIIIYLTANLNFPLVLYPLVRQDPRIFKDEMDKKINLIHNNKINIYPQPGLCVMFWGRRTLHGVIFEERKKNCIDDRLSIQFAFDLDNFSYDNEYYYGNK